MEDTFAKRREVLKPCGAGDMSFFSLIEDMSRGLRKPGKGQFNVDPLHRLCTMMRKMKTEAVLLEELKLNNELRDERSSGFG